MHRMKILLVLSVAGSAAAYAQDGAVRLSFTSAGENRLARPWEVDRKTGTPRLSVVQDGGAPALHLRCDRSSFWVQQRLDIDPANLPILSWRWKAVSLPPRGDLRDRARDDQALQVLVLFDRGGAGYRAISYVWDSNAPTGTSTHHRYRFLVYNVDLKVKVVESGTGNLGRWMHVQRNLDADFRELYRTAPSRIAGIRIQTNCQYTGSTAEGLVKEISFTRRN